MKTTAGSSRSYEKDLDSATELSRIMECPVCFEYPRPPIYNCEGGHVTCNNCMELLTKCSLCEAPFSKTRNIVLECIMEKSKLQCVNNPHGCKEVIEWKNMDSHLSQCPFRPIKCYAQDTIREESCLTNFKAAEYIAHLETVHNSYGINSSNILEGMFYGNGENNVKTCFLRDPSTDVIYLIHSKRCPSYVCWWVNASIPQKSLQFAEFSFKKGNSDEIGESIKWRVPVHSTHRCFGDIRDNGECVVLPLNHLRSLFPLTNENEVNWEVHVKIISKTATTSSEDFSETFVKLQRLLLKRWKTLIWVFLLLLFLAVMMFRSSSEKEQFHGNPNYDEHYERRRYYANPQRSQPEENFADAMTFGLQYLFETVFGVKGAKFLRVMHGDNFQHYYTFITLLTSFFKFIFGALASITIIFLMSICMYKLVINYNYQR